MKIFLIIVLIIALVVALFLALVNSYYSLLITSEKPRMRKFFRKHAITLLVRKMREVGGVPFPIFIELHFNRKHYENFYVKEGFNNTMEYIFDNTLSKIVDGEGDNKIFNMEIEDE